MAKKTKTPKSAERPARKTSQTPKKRQAVTKQEAPTKRASSVLGLTMPLARARKLAGDLYEAAGIAQWAEAIETAEEPKKSGLVHLQDSVCEAADFLRKAKATNPKHLQLFCVACHDRDGLPTTDAALRHRGERKGGAGDLAHGVQGRIRPPPPARPPRSGAGRRAGLA